MITTEEVNVLIAITTLVLIMAIITTLSLTAIAISLIKDDPSDVYGN